MMSLSPAQLFPNEPPEFAVACAADAAQRLGVIFEKLPLAAALHDTTSALFYTDSLMTYMDRLYPLSPEDRELLVKLVLPFLDRTHFWDATLQVNCFRVLEGLLKKTSSNPLCDKRLDITLDWRLWYDLIQRVVLLPQNSRPMAALLPKNYLDNLVRCVRRCRRYFTLSAFDEILATLLPGLVPGAGCYFSCQAVLCLLLPTFPANIAQIKAAFPTLVQQLPLCYRCDESVACWLELFSRAAKHCTGLVPLHQYLPKILHHSLSAFRFAIAGQSSPIDSISWPSNLKPFLKDTNTNWGIASQLGRFIVYTLGPAPTVIMVPPDPTHSPKAAAEVGPNGIDSPPLSEVSTTLDTLVALLSSIRTYFHPSNSGNWTVGLAGLLSSLCAYYCRRMSVERRATDGTGAPCIYATAYHLDEKLMCGFSRAQQQLMSTFDGAQQAPSNTFVGVLLSMMRLSQYSKENFMVQCSYLALRALSWVHPRLVLPTVLDDFLPALTSVDLSHRTTSALTGLAALAEPMLNRALYPNGASMLQPLLFASLPGIDPLDGHKTQLTLRWLEAVFTNVPFMDAREGSASLSPLSAHTPPSGHIPRPEVFVRAHSAPTSSAAHHAHGQGRGHDQPFGSASVRANLPDDGTADDARSATFYFSEWSCLFIDKVLRLMEVVGEHGKDKYKSSVDKTTARQLTSCLTAFFSTLSASIFHEVMKRVLASVLASHHPQSAKYYALIFFCACSSRPELAFTTAFPVLINRILVSVSSGGAQSPPAAANGFASPSAAAAGAEHASGARLTSRGASDLYWFMSLLVALLRRSAGLALQPITHSSEDELPYKRVLVVYELTSASEDKITRKLGQKCIRSLLRSLTEVYPLEMHPFGPEVWGGDEVVWVHWQMWARRYEIEVRCHEQDSVVDDPCRFYKGSCQERSLDIKWHVPRLDEIHKAGEIISRVLSQPLAVLTQLSSEKPSDHTLLSSLGQVINIIRGCDNVIGALENEFADTVNNATSIASAAAASPVASPAASAAAASEHITLGGNEAFSKLAPAPPSRCVGIVAPRTTRVLPSLRVLSSVLGTVQLTTEASAGKALPSLRTELARITIDLFRSMEGSLNDSGGDQNHCETSVKVWCKLLKLASLIAVDGSKREKVPELADYHSSTAWTSVNQYAFCQSFNRAALILRALDHHKQRNVPLTYTDNTVYGALLHDMCKAMLPLTLSDFEKIRGKSHVLLLEIILRHVFASSPLPHPVDLCIDSAITALNKSGTKEKQATGALELLRNIVVNAPGIFPNLLSLERRAKIAKCVLHLGNKIDDDRVLTAHHNLCYALVDTMILTPLTNRLVGVTSGSVDPSLVSARNAEILAWNDEIFATYPSFCSDLQSIVSTSGAHQRYQMAAAALLTQLSTGRDLSMIDFEGLCAFPMLAPPRTTSLLSLVLPRAEPVSAVMTFAQALISSSTQMRSVAISALEDALFTQRHLGFAPYKRARATDRFEVAALLAPLFTFAVPSTQPEAVAEAEAALAAQWETLKFCDSFPTGWNGTQLTYTMYGEPAASVVDGFLGRHDLAMSEAEFARFRDLCVSKIDTIVDALVEHHPVINKAASDGRDPEGAAFLITTSQRRRRAGGFGSSNGFDARHALLIRELVFAIPALVLTPEGGEGPLVESLRKLAAKAEDSDAQCTAAEVVAGIVTGTKHWDVPRQLAVHRVVLDGILLPALQSSTSDCVGYWQEAIQLAAGNCDPRRPAMQWFIRSIFPVALDTSHTSAFAKAEQQQVPLASPGGTTFSVNPSSRLKWLKYALPLVLEFGWRTPALSDYIVARCLDADAMLLTLPSKDLRAALARLLVCAMAPYKRMFVVDGAESAQLNNLVQHLVESAHAASTAVTSTCVSPSASVRPPHVAALASVVAEGTSPEYRPAAPQLEFGSPRAPNPGSPHAGAHSGAWLLPPLNVDARGPASNELLGMLHAILDKCLGDDLAGFQKLYVAAVPLILVLAHHPLMDVAQDFKRLAIRSAWTLGSETSLSDTIDAVSSAAQHSAWRVRVTCVHFLTVWVPRNVELLLPKHFGQLLKFCLSMLTDLQTEVRTAAASLLQAIVGCNSALQGNHGTSEVDALHKRLRQLATTKLVPAPKTEYEMAGYNSPTVGQRIALEVGKSRAATLAQRHAGVLGLSSMVLARPYSVPKHVPIILEFLADYVNDPSVISVPLRKMFAEFKRTHADGWHVFRDRFDEQQLDAYMGVELAPSYFA